jgi:hypothetical protein
MGEKEGEMNRKIVWNKIERKIVSPNIKYKFDNNYNREWAESLTK